MIFTRDLEPVTREYTKQLGANANGCIDHIYLHWSAGHYGQAYEDYHLCIDKDGHIYDMSGCDLTQYKPHTWHRNGGAIGIALLCCAGAECNDGIDADLGEEPPTKEQIEAMAQVVADICTGLELAINSNTVMTHCEAATFDGYGPGSGDPETRWDLYYIPDYCGGGNMVDGGSLIRGKAIWYQNNS